MMTQPATTPTLPLAARGGRPPMSDLHFFLTSYAAGLAVFLTILA